MQDHDRKYKQTRTTQRKGKKLFKNENTEDSVNFRGRGCNIPLKCPKYFVMVNVIVLVLLVRSSRPRPHQ